MMNFTPGMCLVTRDASRAYALRVLVCFLCNFAENGNNVDEMNDTKNDKHQQWQGQIMFLRLWNAVWSGLQQTTRCVGLVNVGASGWWGGIGVISQAQKNIQRRSLSVPAYSIMRLMNSLGKFSGASVSMYLLKFLTITCWLWLQLFTCISNAPSGSMHFFSGEQPPHY